MSKSRIKLNNIEKVNQFISEITPLASEFDILHGKNAIDAKSVIGIMTLDLSIPLEIRYMPANGEEETVEKILSKYKA